MSIEQSRVRAMPDWQFFRDYNTPERRSEIFGALCVSGNAPFSADRYLTPDTTERTESAASRSFSENYDSFTKEELASLTTKQIARIEGFREHEHEIVAEFREEYGDWVTVKQAERCYVLGLIPIED